MPEYATPSIFVCQILTRGLPNLAPDLLPPLSAARIRKAERRMSHTRVCPGALTRRRLAATRVHTRCRSCHVSFTHTVHTYTPQKRLCVCGPHTQRADRNQETVTLRPTHTPHSPPQPLPHSCLITQDSRVILTSGRVTEENYMHW